MTQGVLSIPPVPRSLQEGPLPALVLHAVTGSVWWDAGASIAIGLLLGAVAFLLARRTKGLLIDESATPEAVEQLCARVNAAPWVADADVVAVFIGPGQLLVIAHVTPTARAAARTAGKLVADAAALRRDLLALEAVSATEITRIAARADPGPPGGGYEAAGA